jgi:hypothetical protein
VLKSTLPKTVLFIAVTVPPLAIALSVITAVSWIIGKLAIAALPDGVVAQQVFVQFPPVTLYTVFGAVKVIPLQLPPLPMFVPDIGVGVPVNAMSLKSICANALTVADAPRAIVRCVPKTLLLNIRLGCTLRDTVPSPKDKAPSTVWSVESNTKSSPPETRFAKDKLLNVFTPEIVFAPTAVDEKVTL